MYVRPHELEIEHSAERLRQPESARGARQPGRIRGQGVFAGVPTLACDLNVEVSPERYGELALKEGDTVYVSPRKVRVFVPEYMI